MSSGLVPLRLAVLIDADNVPSRIADDLFREIAKLGMHLSAASTESSVVLQRAGRTPSPVTELFLASSFQTCPAKTPLTLRW